MAFFIAAGIISNDIVRRETRKGVLTTFRLQTGAPRGGKLWIDIECWGHLAGTIAHHATKGRGVSVSGRLTQKNWRDVATGEARQRYIITASDIDLHPTAEATMSLVPNAVLLTGTVETVHPDRTVKSGVISCFQVSAGKANTKTGRLHIEAEIWHPESKPSPKLHRKDPLTIIGALIYRSNTVPNSTDHVFLSGRTTAHPRQSPIR